MGLFSSLFGSDKSKSSTGQNAGLSGTGYKQVTSQNFSPEQMQLFKRLFGQVGEDTQLGKLAAGDQSQFAQIEEPALQQFSGLQGSIASRFSGSPSDPRMNSARRSSGFQNTMNQHASNFAQLLQAKRLELQLQAMQDLRGMSTDLLGARPYENYFTEQQRSPWKTGLSAALPIGGALLGGFLGGGLPGAYAGSQIGGAIGRSFLD